MSRFVPNPKTARVLCTALIAQLCLPLAAAQTSRPRRKSASGDRPLSAREIVAKVSPSLVLVVTQDKDGNNLAQGSGFFFRPGLVATNLHLLKRASQGYVKIVGDDVRYKIKEVRGVDIDQDLCALFVAASAPPLTIAQLPRRTDKKVSPLSQSELQKEWDSAVPDADPVATGSPPQPNARTGDEVYVAGNPMGMEGTFSKGIVSAIRPDRGVIQIDAAISPGSSGGPIINTRGQVIGIATFSVVNGQNLNFGAPAYRLEGLEPWRLPVELAGAIAVSDLENDRLKSAVHTVHTRASNYEYRRETNRFEEGDITRMEIRAYDASGNLIESGYSLGPGQALYKVHREYDHRGFIVREWSSTSSQVKNLTLEQGLNRKIAAVSFSKTVEEKTPGGRVFWSRTYDRDGNEVEETWYPENKPDRKTVRTFDTNGWVVEETVFVDGTLESITRFSYEVDQRGNWIRRNATTKYIQDSDLGFLPSEVTHREISYHN